MYFKTKESLKSNQLYATSQPFPPLAKAARPTSRYLENLQPQEILECPLCPQIHGSAYNISKIFYIKNTNTSYLYKLTLGSVNVTGALSAM